MLVFGRVRESLPPKQPHLATSPASAPLRWPSVVRLHLPSWRHQRCSWIRSACFETWVFFQGWFQGTPIMGPPIMVSFLYYSHIFWDLWDTIPLIFWGWKRRRNASRNLQKVELKCHVKCMCTLKGITNYHLGKGKSWTQKCRLGWNMLVPRRVCTWSFHVIPGMCEIKLHTWTHLFTERCMHLWRLIFYFAQTGIGSKYLIHMHPHAKSNVEEGNFFDHMWILLWIDHLGAHLMSD